jgi:tetratricopeptide (TPR) repeat protein
VLCKSKQYYLKLCLPLLCRGNKAGKSITLNNIALIYHAQGNYTTALTHFTDSLAISQKIGNKAEESTTLNNIASIYQAQGDYTTALTYFCA